MATRWIVDGSAHFSGCDEELTHTTPVARPVKTSIERTRMTSPRTHSLHAVRLLGAFGCTEPRVGRLEVKTDAAILQAEIRDDWQEGSTCGIERTVIVIFAS
jgi:hypothetical protein